MRLTRAEFQRLVVEAVQELPEQIRGWLDNVDIIVEAWPTLEQLEEQGLSDPHELLGLYQGIPQVEREGYNLALPDRVALFQGPIEAACRTPEEIREEVRITVAHELAHHFGMDDAQLEHLGL
ncbi:MAG: metallopeptidase family protein [Dehalococcoidia bacterium]